MQPRIELSGQPQWVVLTAASVLLAAVGGLDFATGSEYSAFVFYAFPLLVVVWKFERAAAIAFACLSGVIWYWANSADNHLYQTTLGFAIAAITRLVYLIFVAIGGAAVKDRQRVDRERIQALEHAQKLEREILRASELEHQRVGRDLHDSLGPHLAALGIAAKTLAEDLRSKEIPEQIKAEQLAMLARQAAVLTRDLSRGIFPVHIDETGLSSALEDLAFTTTQLAKLTVQFTDNHEIRVTNPEASMHLYRIAQEALNNALVHGKATHALIVFTVDDNHVVLTISDNGQGMDPSVASLQGMGLSTMGYRATALGGRLTINSQPGDGTIVSCRIPILTGSFEYERP